MDSSAESMDEWKNIIDKCKDQVVSLHKKYKNRQWASNIPQETLD